MSKIQVFCEYTSGEAERNSVSSGYGFGGGVCEDAHDWPEDLFADNMHFIGAVREHRWLHPEAVFAPFGILRGIVGPPHSKVALSFSMPCLI